MNPVKIIRMLIHSSFTIIEANFYRKIADDGVERCCILGAERLLDGIFTTSWQQEAVTELLKLSRLLGRGIETALPVRNHHWSRLVYVHNAFAF